MTFLLDQLIILLKSPTITNFDSYTRPYRKKNKSTYNHKWVWPNNVYELISSTRSKSSRGGIGVFSRAIHRGSAEGISSRNTIKILPDDLQYLFSWGTKPSFKRRSLRPGQTVPPTPSSGSAAPSSPVARSSQRKKEVGWCRDYKAYRVLCYRFQQRMWIRHVQQLAPEWYYRDSVH